MLKGFLNFKHGTLDFKYQKMETLILEACVENLRQAQLAQTQGANRLELCGRLDLGGITPNPQLIQEVIQQVNIPVKVMIRPRGGNFVYSQLEIEKIKESIVFCKTLHIPEIVTGILKEDNSLNLEIIRMLTQLASPMKVTIHKAIDETPDPILELKKLMELSFPFSILTSGKAQTAIEGKNLIKEMMQMAKGHFTIIPAGKITNHNLMQVHQLIGAKEYHGRKIVGALI